MLEVRSVFLVGKDMNSRRRFVREKFMYFFYFVTSSYIFSNSDVTHTELRYNCKVLEVL